MATPASPPEWCSATVIRFAGVDVVPPKYYFHYSLMPSIGSTAEWCFAKKILFVRVDIVPLK